MESYLDRIKLMKNEKKMTNEQLSERTGLPLGTLSKIFNLYVEYIIRNAGLEEAQAGIKIVGRNINNLRYADTTFMAEIEKELKSLL